MTHSFSPKELQNRGGGFFICCFLIIIPVSQAISWEPSSQVPTQYATLQLPRTLCYYWHLPLPWSGPVWRVQLSSADKLAQIYPSFVNWPRWNWENGFQSFVIKSTQIRRCQLRKDQKPVWQRIFSLLTSNPWEESRKEQVWRIEMLDCILFK